jgi:hypothetical protein
VKTTIKVSDFCVVSFSFPSHLFSPEQLWILNPKRILKKLDLDLPGKQSGQEDTVDKAAQATGKLMFGSDHC